MMRHTIAAVLCAAALLGAVSAQSRPASPEAVIRSLMTAIYANDVAAYENLTMPDPRRSRLVSGGRVNEAGLRELTDDPDSLQIKIKRTFQHRGRDVQPDASGDYPVGTTAIYMSAHRGGPMMVTLVRRPEGWKVDVRWWLAMTDLMSGAEPKRGTAAYAARALAASLIALDRQQAAKIAMPGANMGVLFLGAPRSREPSGVLEASVAEMPVVRLGPGEFCQMPSGRVVEGSTAEDVQVLVGLFGPTEVPFVVRRVGSEWRVEAEPYFALLMR